MDNQVQIPQEIKAFLQNLIKEAGIEPLDEAMQGEMVLELYSKLDNFLTSVIIKNMPPEHLDEFIKLNEENKSREEIDKYMREKMPNAEEIFAKAFIDFRDIYLGNVGVVGQGQIPTPNITN